MSLKTFHHKQLLYKSFFFQIISIFMFCAEFYGLSFKYTPHEHPFLILFLIADILMTFAQLMLSVFIMYSITQVFFLKIILKNLLQPHGWKSFQFLTQSWLIITFVDLVLTLYIKVSQSSHITAESKNCMYTSYDWIIIISVGQFCILYRR